MPISESKINISKVAGLQTALDSKFDKNDPTAKGDKGDAGVQGIQGLKGDKGDIGNTGASGASGIVNSATVPVNPYSGMFWNEIDSNNRLIESWIYLNNNWVSSTKKSFSIAINSVITTGLFALFPVPPNYNYFLSNLRFAYYPNGSFTANDYWQFSLAHIKNNGAIIQNFLTLTLNAAASSISYSINNSINLTLTPLTDGTPQTLKLTGNKQGSGSIAVGINYSAFIDYQLIRK